jgi:hypothetical protein
MGSPKHGSTKRRATSSKVTAISPGEMEAVCLGPSPVQERADHVVVEPKARSALRRAQSVPLRSPSTKRVRGNSPAARSMHHKMKKILITKINEEIQRNQGIVLHTLDTNRGEATCSAPGL